MAEYLNGNVTGEFTGALPGPLTLKSSQCGAFTCMRNYAPPGPYQVCCSDGGLSDVVPYCTLRELERYSNSIE